MTAIQRAYTAHCDRAELVRSVAAIYASAHEALKRAAQQMREHGEPNGAALLEQHALDVDGEGAEHIDALTKTSTPPTPERCSDASSHETASQQSPTVAEGNRVAPRASDGRAELLSDIERAASQADGYCVPGTQQHEHARKCLSMARGWCMSTVPDWHDKARGQLDAALRVMGAIK